MAEIGEKIITLNNLTYYNSKVKHVIDDADAETLKNANSYTNNVVGELPEGYTVKQYVDDAITSSGIIITEF